MEGSANRLGRRMVKLGLVLLALTLVLWLGTIGWLAWSLQGRVTRLVQMSDDPKTLKVALVADQVHGARQELTLLRGALAPLLWLGVRVGGDAGAGEPLADAGLESAVAADEALSALAPALADLDPSSLSLSSMPRVLDALAATRPAMRRSQEHVNRAAADLAQIKGPLSPSVAKVIAQATKGVELARVGFGGALVAPEMLGRSETRTYLVLVQNSDELRASGGFITNIGRIELKHGTVISQTFQDSYAVDDFTNYYPDPPKPLYDFMGSEQWVLRDSNWSPDFPTTARDAIRLYQVSRSEKIDGVIAINQKTVQMLMGGLEPLNVEGFAEPVTAANAVSLFQEAWNPAGTGTSDAVTWIFSRKQFVGTAVRAAMDRLFSGKVNWVRLAEGVADAIRQRQLMIYTTGPEVGSLHELGWDGALYSGPGDYMMVVDSNVGFSKVAPLIAESVDYQVALEPDGTGQGTVTVDYAHQGKQAGIECSPTISYDLNLTYDKMVNRCYYDYVRILAPLGSTLLGADSHRVPSKYLLSGQDAEGIADVLPDEGSHSSFGQFFVVEYGTHLQTRFQYRLPTVVKIGAENAKYSLYLQKQSGTDAVPVRVTVTLPPQARLLSANPPPTTQAASVLRFDLTLSENRRVEIVYAPLR